MKLFHLVFLIFLVLGTMVTCSSSSWAMAWVGLEINLMSFIPLLLFKLNSNSIENAIKYFLVQAMASMLIISSVVFNNYLNSINFNPMSTEMVLMSLGLKAGVAPLHFWFPQIMALMEWPQAMILLTWQKIAPMILMAFMNSWVIIVLIITSAILGATMGLNQNSFKKLLTFSSIINSAWLMTASMVSMMLWWMFFLLYCTVVISIVWALKIVISDWVFNYSYLSLNKVFSSFMIINMMSLAGMPPFLGFLIKIMVLELIIKTSMGLLLVLSLVMSSVMAFYFYARVMYSMMFRVNKMSKINFTQMLETNPFLFILLSVSLFLNFTMPAMVYMS